MVLAFAQRLLLLARRLEPRHIRCDDGLSLLGPAESVAGLLGVGNGEDWKPFDPRFSDLSVRNACTPTDPRARARARPNLAGFALRALSRDNQSTLDSVRACGSHGTRRCAVPSKTPALYHGHSRAARRGDNAAATGRRSPCGALPPTQYLAPFAPCQGACLKSACLASHSLGGPSRCSCGLGNGMCPLRHMRVPPPLTIPQAPIHTCLSPHARP
jgi:hypothetical protein